jgi:hypothetical protein
MTHLHHSLRSRKTAVIATVGAAAAIAATFVAARPAGALPIAQSGCNFGTIVPTTANGYIPLTNARTVSLSGDTFLKAEATADVGVDTGAEVRLAWSVNNNPPVESFFGPANFANHQEFFETRTTFAIISVGVGTRTIQPFIKVNGPSGAKATVLNRCSTVEASTS